MTYQAVDDRKSQQREILLKQLEKTPVVQVCCEKTGIGRATYYRWRKEDLEFKEASDKALCEGRLLMNDMAESQLLSGVKNQNMTAIIFWLKNNHSVYKNKVEVSGEIKTKDTKLSPEQEEIVKKALAQNPLPNISVNEIQDASN